MKIVVKRGNEPIWAEEKVKHVTIYNPSDEEDSKSVVIEGFFGAVPNGYFVQSFSVDLFDKICFEVDD